MIILTNYMGCKKTGSLATVNPKSYHYRHTDTGLMASFPQ